MSNEKKIIIIDSCFMCYHSNTGSRCCEHDKFAIKNENGKRTYELSGKWLPDDMFNEILPDCPLQSVEEFYINPITET